MCSSLIATGPSCGAEQELSIRQKRRPWPVQLPLLQTHAYSYLSEANMNKDTLCQISIVVAVAATIVVNGLADALPLNGLGTGAISDMFPV